MMFVAGGVLRAEDRTTDEIGHRGDECFELGLAFIQETVKAGGEGIAIDLRGAVFDDDMASGGDLLEDLNIMVSALYPRKGSAYA